MLAGLPPTALLCCTSFFLECLSIVVTLLEILALLVRWLVSVVDTPLAMSSYIVMDLLKPTLVIIVDYILMWLFWMRPIMPFVSALDMLITTLRSHVRLRICFQVALRFLMFYVLLDMSPLLFGFLLYSFLMLQKLVLTIVSNSLVPILVSVLQNAPTHCSLVYALVYSAYIHLYIARTAQ